VTLVRHPDDILEGLGPLIGPVRRQPGEQLHTPRELMLSEQERDVLNLLSVEPQPVDDVLATAPLDSSRVLATLTVLEMRRLVRRLPGGYVMRCSH
jgi:DNA processing protein